ncbi:hypothetical protein G6F50_016706 [Rhizopus delemar]|uniref:Uncharacterized protein n=1 Tax=Rhizopus delemar TaxID=936053 RepID=A0A9P6XSG8_9FUNG|nr:hypothetical protein G6F50_016706 [Rhizopus delemar]
MRYAWSACHDAGRHRPSPADRHAPVNRRGSVRPPSRRRPALPAAHRTGGRWHTPATGACACRRPALNSAWPGAGPAVPRQARAVRRRARFQYGRASARTGPQPSWLGGSNGSAASGWAGSLSRRTRSSACSSACSNRRNRPTPRSYALSEASRIS